MESSLPRLPICHLSCKGYSDERKLGNHNQHPKRMAGLGYVKVVLMRRGEQSLLPLVQYGRGRGWRVRVHKLKRIAPYLRGEPVTERFKAWGAASLVYSCPRAELAYVPGALVDTMQGTLAHELGHCEQYEELHSDPNFIMPNQGAVAYEEDAWHRGFRIIGELGISLTENMVDFADACLHTYKCNQK